MSFRGKSNILMGTWLALAVMSAMGAEGFFWGGDLRFRIEGLNHIPTDRPLNAGACAVSRDTLPCGRIPSS